MNSDNPDNNSREDAKNELINFLQNSPADQTIENFNDFIATVGRETARQRHQYYVEPFKLQMPDISHMDN